MEQKMEALDLSMGIKRQKKFVNYGCLNAKARRAKEEEDIIQEAKQQPIEEDEYFPRATHLARKLKDKDPNLDFMDSDRREKLVELYSQDPRALPIKEVKPLKFSKIDRFANNIEINLDLAGNAQLKALEAFEQADADVGYWHLQNFSDFIRNAHALSNLERFKIRKCD
jgi:hypothetical protein